MNQVHICGKRVPGRKTAGAKARLIRVCFVSSRRPIWLDWRGQVERTGDKIREATGTRAEGQCLPTFTKIKFMKAQNVVLKNKIPSANTAMY